MKFTLNEIGKFNLVEGYTLSEKFKLCEKYILTEDTVPTRRDGKVSINHDDFLNLCQEVSGAIDSCIDKLKDITGVNGIDLNSENAAEKKAGFFKDGKQKQIDVTIKKLNELSSKLTTDNIKTSAQANAIKRLLNNAVNPLIDASSSQGSAYIRKFTDAWDNVNWDTTASDEDAAKSFVGAIGPQVEDLYKALNMANQKQNAMEKAAAGGKKNIPEVEKAIETLTKGKDLIINNLKDDTDIDSAYGSVLADLATQYETVAGYIASLNTRLENSGSIKEVSTICADFNKNFTAAMLRAKMLTKSLLKMDTSGKTQVDGQGKDGDWKSRFKAASGDAEKLRVVSQAFLAATFNNNQVAITTVVSLGKTFWIECEYYGYEESQNPFIKFLKTVAEGTAGGLKINSITANNYNVLHNVVSADATATAMLKDSNTKVASSILFWDTIWKLSGGDFEQMLELELAIRTKWKILTNCPGVCFDTKLCQSVATGEKTIYQCKSTDDDLQTMLSELYNKSSSVTTNNLPTGNELAGLSDALGGVSRAGTNVTPAIKSQFCSDMLAQGVSPKNLALVLSILVGISPALPNEFKAVCDAIKANVYKTAPELGNILDNIVPYTDAITEDKKLHDFIFTEYGNQLKADVKNADTLMIQLAKQLVANAGGKTTP